jgi:hypothetical protein
MHVSAANTVVLLFGQTLGPSKGVPCNVPQSVTDQTNIGTPAENVYMLQDLSLWECVWSAFHETACGACLRSPQPNPSQNTTLGMNNECEPKIVNELFLADPRVER